MEAGRHFGGKIPSLDLTLFRALHILRHEDRGSATRRRFDNCLLCDIWGFHIDADKRWVMMGCYVLSTCRPWSWRHCAPTTWVLYNIGITYLALVKYKPQNFSVPPFFSGKHWLTKCPAQEKRTVVSGRDVQRTFTGICVYYPNSKHMSLVWLAVVLFAVCFPCHNRAMYEYLPADVSYLVMLRICLYKSRQVCEIFFFFFSHLSSFGRKSMKGVNHFFRPEAVWHSTSRLLLPLQCVHKHAGSTLHLTSACINMTIVFSFFVSSINSFSISEYKFVIKLYFMCFYEPLN
jgi:hypothetical protein